jgi:hypothetical protein
VVAHELSSAHFFDEGRSQMTIQRSQIFRGFARGESIPQIAESCGVSYRQASSQLRREVGEWPEALNFAGVSFAWSVRRNANVQVV